jgi:glycosyltransferase involved in cell wall biosynthesis
VTEAPAASTALRPGRALLIGPVFLPGDVGGLQLALSDVAEQLTARGWQIDTLILAASSAPSPLRTTFFSTSRLSPFRSWPVLGRLWKAFPLSARRFLSTLAMPRQYWENVSDNLHAIETMLTGPQAYDIVLVGVDGNAPGCTALACARHRRVVSISLQGLANELTNQWWRWLHPLVSLRLGRRGHPFLFRRITWQQIKLALFASRQWRQAALQAGLPEACTHTIYFGIPLPEPLPRPAEARRRILWVGRLSPEKGLHLLLSTLAEIRRRLPDVSLTVVAGQGNDDYRQEIMELVCRHGLTEIVEFRAPVDRAALQKAYAEHDLLFFYSAFPEPVALVLMEAFAAGLPVVASRAEPGAALIQHEITCLCYQPEDKASLVDAISRLLADAPLRQRLSQNAQQLVRQEFSLDKMGAAYDAVLRQFMSKMQ